MRFHVGWKKRSGRRFGGNQPRREKAADRMTGNDGRPRTRVRAGDVRPYHNLQVAFSKKCKILGKTILLRVMPNLDVPLGATYKKVLQWPPFPHFHNMATLARRVLMPIGISQRAFAKLEGVSRTLVQRKINSGHLETYEDGSLNPKLVGTSWHGEAVEEQVQGRVVADAKASKIPSKAESEAKKGHYLALLRQLEYDEKVGKVAPVEEF